jgi:hypothetical protein
MLSCGGGMRRVHFRLWFKKNLNSIFYSWSYLIIGLIFIYNNNYFYICFSWFSRFFYTQSLNKNKKNNEMIKIN